MNNGATPRPRVLGIAGSPRRGGNIDLLPQAVSGAEIQGARTSIVTLSELNIAPCRHCDKCSETGKCVIDDMQRLSQELREVDYLILASPFFHGPTSTSKSYDQSLPSTVGDKIFVKLSVAANPHSKRKGLFLSVGGTKLLNLFEPAIATVKSWFATLDIIYTGILLFSGIDEKGAITQHPTALKEAFSAGQNLIQD